MLGLRGEEDHRDVARLRIGLEAPAHLVAVQSRHHDVEQDQVGRRVGRGDPQRLLAAARDLHLVVVLEQAAHQGEVVRRVVHHEDRWPSVVESRAVHGRALFRRTPRRPPSAPRRAASKSKARMASSILRKWSGKAARSRPAVLVEQVARLGVVARRAALRACRTRPRAPPRRRRRPILASAARQRPLQLRDQRVERLGQRVERRHRSLARAARSLMARSSVVRAAAARRSRRCCRRRP